MQPEIQTPIKRLISRHSFLSLRKIEDLCVNKPHCSKSSIGLFSQGKLPEKKAVLIRKELAQVLPNFLLQNGLTLTEIDQELSTIFKQGEYKKMINKRKVLPKEVCSWFGFNNLKGEPIDPFSQQPRNRQEVFTCPQINSVVDQVIDIVKFQGFGCVIGDIGSGKTIVRQLVADKLDEKTKLIFPETFDMSRVTSANISRAILEDFNIEHIPNDSVSRAKIVKKTLANAYKNGLRVALGFDESHRMIGQTISALKNFDEMNSGGFQKYLGIVLFGQPSLMTRLEAGDKKISFREIYERIIEIKMPEFSEYAQDYFAHRLQLANSDITLFDNNALELILSNATTPLQLANIVNTALIHAFEFKTKTVIGEAIRTKMFFANTKR